MSKKIELGIGVDIVQKEKRKVVDQQLPCDNCGRVFQTLAALKSHLRGHDGTQKLIVKSIVLEERVCLDCGKICRGLSGLTTHQRIHTGQSKVSGAKTGKTLKARGSLKGSRNPNYGEKSRPWLEDENSNFRKFHRDHPDFGENQKGDKNPVHKVKHLYEDPEYVAKITRGLREHAAQKKGSTYEEVYGPEKAAEYKKKLQDASPVRMAKFKRRETAPERIIREMLESLNLPFQQEAPFGYYTVDFLLEEKKLILQADGDYWHVHPDKFPNPDESQKTTQRVDASCNSFIRNQGYQVLRFWESDLHNKPEECLKRIEEITNA